jgi:hypothetical protein
MESVYYAIKSKPPVILEKRSPAARKPKDRTLEKQLKGLTAEQLELLAQVLTE